jgi:hypothetical protein
MLREKSEQEYKKEIQAEETVFAHYTSEDLKKVVSIRETNFWKQFKLLFLRVVIGFWR